MAKILEKNTSSLIDTRRPAQADLSHNEPDTRVLNGPYALIIEHIPAIQEMLCRTLELAGYRPIAVVNGDEALSWIDGMEQSGEVLAFILFDVRVLSVRQEEVLRSLRAKWAVSPPVIFLTTNQQVYDALKTVEQVLLKPFHLYDLLLEVKKNCYRRVYRHDGTHDDD